MGEAEKGISGVAGDVTRHFHPLFFWGFPRIYENLPFCPTEKMTRGKGHLLDSTFAHFIRSAPRPQSPYVLGVAQ